MGAAERGKGLARMKEAPFEERLRREGCRTIAGVDEVGRGPLAGPVVAAAVVLPEKLPPGGLALLDDSKKLSKKRRAAAHAWLRGAARGIGIGSASPGEIDRIDIRRATHLAMRRALEALPIDVDHVLVDGRPIPDLPFPQTAIVGGDGLSPSIAAASIVAKVLRDGWMAAFESAYPGYGFDRHAGYPTRAHIDALSRLGPCPIHRRSFSPVRRALDSPRR